MRNAEFGMRNVTVGLVTRTTHPCNSAFHIPHSALGSPHAPRLSPRPLLPPPLLLLRLLHRGPQAHPRAGVRGGGAAGAGARPRLIGWCSGDVVLGRRHSVAPAAERPQDAARSEEHTSELQSRLHLVCRLLLEKKKKKKTHLQFSRNAEVNSMC